MRILSCVLLAFVLVVALAGCGGSGSGAKPAGPTAQAEAAQAEAAQAEAAQAEGAKSKATKSKDSAFDADVEYMSKHYCERYSGCARERVWVEWKREREANGGSFDDEPTDTDLAPTLVAEVARCRGIVDKLTAEQAEWLESCTGCGGTCGVYDCLDNVPDPKSLTPYECTMYDDAFGPPPDDGGE